MSTSQRPAAQAIYEYVIDGRRLSFPANRPSPEFRFGKDETLSGNGTDITFGQPWYERGYQAFRFLDDKEFADLKAGLTCCIGDLIAKELGIANDGFQLDKYHELVRTNERHFKIVSRTRDLFPEDFNFPLTAMIGKFQDILGSKLSDINPHSGRQLHIIVRINRPGSNDFNPPHKDIYEELDGPDHYIPQFINLWVPIAGVTERSSLPVAPSSHLLPESQVLRTFEGGVISGNKYRVRMIKEWGGSNRLQRAKVGDGEVLFFSSHLVHGLAVNEEEDATRVALEFRLFKRN